MCDIDRAVKHKQKLAAKGKAVSGEDAVASGPDAQINFTTNIYRLGSPVGQLNFNLFMQHR